MSMSITSILLMLVIAAACGYVGKAIAGGARGGLLIAIALGFLGALLGPWVARKLSLTEPFMLTIGGHLFPILWSIVGAALVVAAFHLVSRRRR